MYRTCELVLINKVDLPPHLEVDLEELLANIDAVHPAVETMWSALAPARASRSGALAGGAGDPARRRGGDVSRTVTEPRRSCWRAAWLSAETAGGRLYERESAHIAELCHAVAERCARGGRLLACACSPAGL